MEGEQGYVSYYGPVLPPYRRSQTSEPNQTIPLTQPEGRGRLPRIRPQRSWRPWPCNQCQPTRTFGSQKTLLAHMRGHVIGDLPTLAYIDHEVPSVLCSVCLAFHHRTPFYRCKVLEDIKAGRRELDLGSCPICLRPLTLHLPGDQCWWVLDKRRHWRNIRCGFHHQMNHRICRECHEKNPTLEDYLFEGIGRRTRRSRSPEEPLDLSLIER